MFGRAPPFWWLDRPGLEAGLLTPAAALYGALARRRMTRSGYCCAVPVLCVGNFTVGGAGKTPIAIEMARRLKARGQSPAFLSRGHGRHVKDDGVIMVEAELHHARQVGDEPLLLARYAPTFVAADRVRGAAAAIEARASILIMDDGFQNPNLEKTASIVVVDGGSGTGNGYCIPAGPLRAPIDAQWPKASLVCIIGAGQPGERVGDEARHRGIPVVTARLDPDANRIRTLAGRRLLAFSGIGRPDKFFATLNAHGCDVVAHRSFADHHVYRAEERRRLMVDAKRLGADLVTTEKDRVRLPADFDCHVLPVRIAFEAGEAALDDLLETISRP